MTFFILDKCIDSISQECKHRDEDHHERVNNQRVKCDECQYHCPYQFKDTVKDVNTGGIDDVFSGNENGLDRSCH